MEKYDVIVVGAGPAGSTTARAAAERGLKVLMIDRDNFAGENTACGGGLAPFILEHYDLKREVIQRYINGARITARGKLIKNASIAFEFEKPAATTRRVDFDRYLAEIAVKKGAEYLGKTLAKEVKKNKVYTSRGVFEGKVIVGADGVNSIVANAMGLPQWKAEELALGVVYEISMPNKKINKKFGNAIHIYFDKELVRHGYAWVFPGDNILNVGVGYKSTYLNGKNLRNMLDLFMKKENIDGKILTFKARALPLSGPRKCTVKKNMLLVGDSAGHAGPALGEGIRYAMKLGEIAGKYCAAHLKAGVSLESYENEWRRQYYWMYKAEKIAQKIYFFAEATNLIPITLKIMSLGSSKYTAPKWVEI